MSESVTKVQAIEVCQLLTAEHQKADYFQKAEVVSTDVGFGVDLWVDRVKWAELKPDRPPPRINRVPVCILITG